LDNKKKWRTRSLSRGLKLRVLLLIYPKGAVKKLDITGDGVSKVKVESPKPIKK